jgi:hypothetical protein
MLETDTNCSSEFQDFRHQIIRYGIAIVGFVQLFWVTQNPKIQLGIMKNQRCYPFTIAMINGLVSGKIETGNHRFSHSIWGFPAKIFP